MQRSLLASTAMHQLKNRTKIQSNPGERRRKAWEGRHAWLAVLSGRARCSPARQRECFFDWLLLPALQQSTY